MKQPYIQEIFFILIQYFFNFIEKHKGGDGVNLTICEEDEGDEKCNYACYILLKSAHG